MKQYVKYLAAGIAASTMAWAPPVNAQDNAVTLRSLDKNFEASGELVSSDADFYVLRTIVGEMNVPRGEVECIGAACPVAPVAVAESQITLSSVDGSSYTGELLGFDGTNYLLKTAVGVLTIRSEFVQCEGAACPAETQATTADTTVVLRSGDGSAYEGTLQGYDGTNYILETSLGVLTIRGEFVQCEGAACPETGPEVARFTIASPPDEGEAFIGEALARFVGEKSLNLTRSIGNDGSISYLIGGNNGALVADITVIPASDSSSIEALFSQSAAFALTREAFSPAEVSQVTGMAVSNVSTFLDSRPIALDALVAQINPQNRVDSISITEMGDILSGHITNWAQIGGDDAEITVFVLNENNNLTRMIQRDVLDPRGLKISNAAVVVDSADALAKAVVDTPNAFTISYRSAGQDSKIPSTRNTCNMFASPNAFSLQTDEYPLTMTWNLYTLKNRTIPDVAMAVADYLVSNQGQASAKEVGLVGLAIDRQPMSAQGERLLSAMLAESLAGQGISAYRNYLAEVSTATRLSTTLRFLTGSSTLDERAQADIRRISDLISSGVLDRNKLLLIGFSDSVGSFNGNVNLSKNRAGVVKSLLLQDNIGQLDTADILTLGFGPVAPVGCNNTPDGRSLNRRVEVWVRGANQQRLR